MKPETRIPKPERNPKAEMLTRESTVVCLRSIPRNRGERRNPWDLQMHIRISDFGLLSGGYLCPVLPKYILRGLRRSVPANAALSKAQTPVKALYQIRADSSRGRRWAIEEKPVVVGRSALADIRVEDQGISRSHFVIVREGEGYLVEDLNSRNGTWLRGRRVLAAKLRPNDCIRAGRTWFLFADRPGSSTTACRPRLGPHGTVVVSTAPGCEDHSSQAGASWGWCECFKRLGPVGCPRSAGMRHQPSGG